MSTDGRYRYVWVPGSDRLTSTCNACGRSYTGTRRPVRRWERWHRCPRRTR